MCDWAARAVECEMRLHFQTCGFTLTRKANMMSNSANTVLGL